FLHNRPERLQVPDLPAYAFVPRDNAEADASSTTGKTAESRPSGRTEGNAHARLAKSGTAAGIFASVPTGGGTHRRSREATAAGPGGAGACAARRAHRTERSGCSFRRSGCDRAV